MSRGLLARIFSALLIAVFIAVVLGISWLGTCAVIYCIAMCFGWVFRWSVATGIWLILLLCVRGAR